MKFWYNVCWLGFVVFFLLVVFPHVLLMISLQLSKESRPARAFKMM